MKNKAFTLAEALITLGIIGVIASITLPTLIANMQVAELQARFKTTYNELDSFARYFQAKEGISASLFASFYGTPALRDKYIQYFSKTLKTSNWTAANSGTVSHDHKWYSLTNPYKATVTSPCDNAGFLKDGQNRIISFDDAPPRGFNGPRVCVDINGDKGPNIYGLDFFSFLFTTDGSIIASGENHPHNNHFDEFDSDKSIGNAWQAGTTTGASKCYNSAQGLTCAYYALYDMNPKNSNQTYWKDFVGKKQYLK